jgi:predicted ATPase/ATP/maltotriose-dependent transcriptional regulator MalT
LHEDSEEVASREAIAVESVAWYSWLEQHRSFRFVDPTSTFTARKEQRAGSWYWYAYRRKAGRLHTAYLGRSAELSATRLQVIADELAGASGQPTSPTKNDKLIFNLPATLSYEHDKVATTGQALLHTLPQQLTSLIGREQEMAAAVALLRSPEVRLLSLIGTAGVGKTSLAFEVARRLMSDFADGVYVVFLAPLSDPDLVLPSIAHRLGLMESGSQPVLELLKLSQRDKRRLLLLDNFEHVIGASTVLTELLEACPDLKLLVTSREVLRLRGEHQFAVPPLALPDPRHLPDAQSLAQVAAVNLFLQRAQAIRSDFQLTVDNTATIAQICLRLDGLPLAIELAAARIKLLPVQALLARLDHRLSVLIGGARDLPFRQQTLRTTLAWSYELLTEEEQQLFRRLSVCAGGCSLEAIKTICAGMADETEPMLDTVASLIDKSLLLQTEQESAEPRFVMLETIREYGLEMLAASGEEQATRQAHAAYYLALAEKAESGLRGPKQITWFQQLEREHDNLRSALSWFLEQGSYEPSGELALRLSCALRRFWEIRGYTGEGRRWFERALEISHGVRSAIQAKALVGAGQLATLQDDFGQAEALCREGLALYQELGDRHGRATALSNWGYAAMMKSNYAEARALEEEALALFQEGGAIGCCVSALQTLHLVLFYQGEYVQSHKPLEESLELSKEGGDIRGYAISLLLMGNILLFEGNPTRAYERYEESLAVSREMGYKWIIATTLHFLGLVAFFQGDATAAHPRLQESLVRFQEVGDRGSMAQILFSQGFVSFGQGEYLKARRLMEKSLEVAWELERKWDTAAYLEGLAAVAAVQEEPVRAVWFMSAAQAQREAIGTPLQSLLQAMHEFTMASVRTQLGEQAFAAAWAQGRMMTPEQILTVQEPLAIPAAVVAELLPMPHSPKSLANHTGLTSRELEVLRLLAQGFTSAQIAERLVIGLVTVNSHVRSIYSKLEVKSRSAATRYAIEHRLV